MTHRTVVQNSHESRRKCWPTRSFIGSFARTAHSIACSALFASRTGSAALICSLARSLTQSRACGNVNDSMSQNLAVLNRSAPSASSSPLSIFSSSSFSAGCSSFLVSLLPHTPFPRSAPHWSFLTEWNKRKTKSKICSSHDTSRKKNVGNDEKMAVMRRV